MTVWLDGLQLVLSWQVLLALLLGSLLGFILGSTPGHGPVFALSLFIPLTITLPALPALSFLVASDAQRCIEAGASKVLVEAQELLSVGDHDLASILAEMLDPSLLMFEIPVSWIQGVHRFDRHRLEVALIRKFGPNVNLANIEPHDLFRLEALRTGLGQDETNENGILHRSMREMAISRPSSKTIQGE